MNYLFVMPKGVSKAQCFNIFPVGIAYVSASLKQAGHNVFTTNLDMRPESTGAVLNDLILDNDIDVMCTGGLSFDCAKVREVIEAARLIKPRVLTVVGGGIISSDPLPAMRVLGADIGVIGEGEITTRALAHALDNGLPYESIPGLIIRGHNNGSHLINQPGDEIVDIDNLAYPDFDGFNYFEWTKRSGSGIVVGSRSCTHNCTFCFHTTGNKYRQRSLDSIFKEITHQIEHFHLKSLTLSDELFAFKKSRIYDFCERIREYNISWGVALRVCDVDGDLLRAMKASGCSGISYGLESADNSVLKSMRKGITVEQIRKALDLTFDTGLNVTGGFIFGDINETGKTTANTLDFWSTNNNKHYMNLTMIRLFPGSYLYKHACDQGIISDKEQFLRDGCPLTNVSKLTNAEYHTLTSLVTELRLHPHVPAKSFAITAIKPNGECEVEFICRKCGAQTSDNVMFWFGKESCCPSCGLTNFVDPFQNALHLEDRFSEHLPADHDIALWGAGGIYYTLIKKYSLMSSKRFILVDADKSLQGLTICGKEIYSPDRSLQKDIKTVVITALSRKDEIYSTIKGVWPSVENVLAPAFEVLDNRIVPVLRRV